MSEEVKRQPVTFRYDAINPYFLKMLAEIGHYATEKYGSWEQYSKARLVGEKGPINHIYEHLRQYVMGEPYDHFEGDVGRHLAAVAYNAMIEWHYYKRFGHAPHPLSLVAAEPVKAAWIVGHSTTLSDVAKPATGVVESFAETPTATAKYEYTTTYATGVIETGIRRDDVVPPDDPALPEGDGWDLVGFAASGLYLYWTWRRLRE